MAITVEYLAIFRRTDSFCSSVASFTRLLQVDSEIRVTNGDIHFQGERTCGFQISSGEVTGKKQRYSTCTSPGMATPTPTMSRWSGS